MANGKPNKDVYDPLVLVLKGLDKAKHTISKKVKKIRYFFIKILKLRHLNTEIALRDQQCNGYSFVLCYFPEL